MIIFNLRRIMNDTLFKPAWWLPGMHLQTLWPTFARSRIKLPLQRERIELSDGDFIDLDWVGRQRSNKPIVLILHGLEGSSRSPYAQGMLQSIDRLGCRGVVMNFRGCSGEPNRLPRSYHSGDTRDFSTIVNFLSKQEPRVPIIVIGYSLGGNVLLKWLGEQGQDVANVIAAVAVSVPFELDKSVDRLQQGFSHFYEQHFLRLLHKKMQQKKNMQMPIVVPQSPLSTLREFDDKITAPLHGFASAQDYYVKSSSRQFLKDIRLPTLLLHAKDDPFIPSGAIPLSRELSPCTTLEVTEKGGHIGFVGGAVPGRPYYWLERRILEFLSDYQP